MFRRSMALVDDNVAVQLGENHSYQLFVVFGYRKSGSKYKQLPPLSVRKLISNLFGTSLVTTSHTYLSANRFKSYDLNGSQWVWMEDLAQSLRNYLSHYLGLKPCKKSYKHKIQLDLVLCPTDPTRDPVYRMYVMRITNKNLSQMCCSGSIPTLSRDNFDRFLIEASLPTEAEVFLNLP